MRACSTGYDPTGFEELTVGEMGVHISLKARQKQPGKERDDEQKRWKG